MQIILLFACLAFGGIFVETIGSRVKRAIGGTKIPIQQAPYVVSLRRGGRHVCGGALISTQHVLTTAYCVLEGSRKRMETKVVSGTDNMNRADIGHTIRNIDIHEKFEERKFWYDIAVVTLVAPVEKNDKQHEIALPDAQPPYGEVATLVAFKTKSNEGANTALQEIRVEIEDTFNNEGYRDHVFYGSVQSGAGVSGVDQGSPLAYEGTIVGLVSKLRVKSSKFSYFVNVVKSVKTIKKFMGEDTSLNSEPGTSIGDFMTAGTSSVTVRPYPFFDPSP